MSSSADPTRVLPARGPRAWLASCALALLPVTQDAFRPSPQGYDPVTREWTIRRWALEPAEHAPELALASTSQDWEQRQAALEALLRAGPDVIGAQQREAIRAALADAHPNVRATALAAAARAGLVLEPQLLASLARDPWPEVRHELTRLIARDPSAPGVIGALGPLLADEDPRLVRAARRAALQFAFAELDPPLDLGAATREPADFIATLEILARGARPGQWFGPIAESTAAFEPRERERRLGLLLAAFGILEGWTAETLVHGWLGTPGDDSELEGAARALRLAAAEELGRRGPIPPDLGVCFFSWGLPDEPAVAFGLAAAAADGLARGAQPLITPDSDLGLAERVRSELERAGLASPELFDAAERFLEGALLMAGPEPSALAHALRGAGDGLAEIFWLGAGTQARFFEGAELAHWLGNSAPSVRAALLSSVAQAFARSGDLVSRRTLVEALADADPALRRIAFAALARAADPRPFAEALAKSWRSEDEPTRLLRLRELPRAVALEPFRPEFIELWESGRARQVAVLELLRTFGPDAELAARAGAWFEAELAALQNEAEPSALDAEDPALDFAPRSGRPAETEREGIAKALAALYAALAGEAGTAQLEAWLERAEPLSLEVGKVLVNLLGRHALGRERLVAWLEPPRRTRLRVEAALGLLGERDALLATESAEGVPELAQRAARVLIERYPSCDQPLRARILGSLGGYTQLGLVRARLVETALSGGFDGAERLRALESLERGAQEGPELRDAIEEHLAQVLEAATDIEVRRAAVEALGRSGGERASLALEELAALPSGAPAREHLGDLLLPARARIGRAPDLEREVWSAPRAAAKDELRARFAGRRLSSREFSYRAELEAALHLAQAGRLDELLAAEAWWELDARFLLLLGERLFASTEPALRARALELVRAARIGLEGEAAAPDREQLLVGARALLARAAFAGERPARAAAEVEETLLAWRLSELAPRQLFAPLGPFAPESGRDPLAWLEASVLQARAHAALDAGQPDSARELAQRAGARLGASDLARAQQQRLLALLED